MSTYDESQKIIEDIDIADLTLKTFDLYMKMLSASQNLLEKLCEFTNSHDDAEIMTKYRCRNLILSLNSYMKPYIEFMGVNSDTIKDIAVDMEEIIRNIRESQTYNEQDSCDNTECDK